jgi:hypothetical protein
MPRLQFKTSHEKRRLARRLSRLGQVGAGPSARFGACGKRPEIARRSAAESLAAIRVAVRDDKVARGGRLPSARIPGPDELDCRIPIVALNGACAPDFHDFVRLRCLQT